MINKHVSVGLFENVNTDKSSSSGTRVSLRTDPQTDLEVIPYLEDSFNKIKNLIDDIIRNEPSLNT
ncbi:MAG: hypothetical protein ACJ71K_08800 [Nitrososphaeraceae archaeon]